MIAVDTNVVVRLLTKDDRAQYLKSLAVFQAPSIFISDTVILETEWVLRFSYSFEPDDICQALSQLLGLPNLQVTNSNRIYQALQWHRSGVDFADAFHLASCQQCSILYTFDEQFIRSTGELSSVSVQEPS